MNNAAISSTKQIYKNDFIVILSFLLLELYIIVRNYYLKEIYDYSSLLLVTMTIQLSIGILIGLYYYKDKHQPRALWYLVFI